MRVEEVFGESLIRGELVQLLHEAEDAVSGIVCERDYAG